MTRIPFEPEGLWFFRLIPGQASKGIPTDVAEEWMVAQVPGCVHTDLLANGKTLDPFYGTNERAQQWIERCDWEYRCSFTASPALLARGQVDLLCKGLDTYADVFVNGTLALSANNMFRQWRAPLKSLLVSGDNEIRVRFTSPIREARKAYEALGYVLPATNDQGTPMVSMYTRKAPYHYGWDWGPRFVTSGIWRPLMIEAWDRARIENVHVVQTSLAADRATLLVRTTVVSDGPVSGACVSVRVDGEDGTASVLRDLHAGQNTLECELSISKPNRWWPNGLGEPHLYSIHVTLTWGDAELGAAAVRVGLRTIDVVHEEDEDGKSFTVRVNGEAVFMKGANYIPQDSFLPRVTEEEYASLLRAAAFANMNMLRVWGGGIYECDRFYDLCDELGLLVWQDFMFACSMYPGDEAFFENVRQEAIENVKRLRNHASLALWAGNNEIEVAWARWGWQAKFALTPAAQSSIAEDCRRLFQVVLPSVLSEHDPSRFYTRSSPSANDDRTAPDTVGFGDMHYWGVWHAEEPYTKYSQNVSRFMSEYGFQSFPDIETVKRYAPSAEFRTDSEVMLAHQRHPRGNELIGIYMRRDFQTPKNFAAFLFVSQILQATVIQYAAEAHRRRMPYCGGSLYWQLNDCWPVASWSGIDYFGRYKVLHHFARRFFAAVLVSIAEESGRLGFYVVSDRRSDAELELVVRLVGFDGGEYGQRRMAVRARAATSHEYFGIPIPLLLAGTDARSVVCVAEIFEDSAFLGRATHFFEKMKDLDLPFPGLTLDSTSAAGSTPVVMRVHAERFARCVRLSSGEAEGAFSDNYFDLLAGESVAITWSGSADAEFAVTSLRDTF